ncbi:MAG TPA: type II secretion system minor pseudopilin GspJ [Steroidobacteraceae bacterium]
MNTRHHGFTLVELLVALFITAIIFAIGTSTVNQVINNREGVEAKQQRLLAVQKTMRMFTQDFTQLVPRPVRDPVGNNYQPALRGQPDRQPVVVLTRGGWANPAGVQRPALQRVAYILENGKLRREHFPVLDGTLSTEPIRRELLDGVKSFSIRYMDISRRWRDRWPPPGVPGTQNQTLRLRPIAVEVTLELEDWGKLVRILEVPA